MSVGGAPPPAAAAVPQTAEKPRPLSPGKEPLCSGHYYYYTTATTTVLLLLLLLYHIHVDGLYLYKNDPHIH